MREKRPIGIFTEDIFANDSLYIKTKEVDNRDYYFIPSTNKYIGVGKGKFRGYYCRFCEKFLDESEVKEVKPGVFAHFAEPKSKRWNKITEKMEWILRRHLVKSGSMKIVCSVYACPICGRPGMDANNFGYCSEFHHKMMLDKMAKIILSEE